MMFQSYALFPHLTALDNVALALKMRGVDRPPVTRAAQSADNGPAHHGLAASAIGCKTSIA